MCATDNHIFRQCYKNKKLRVNFQLIIYQWKFCRYNFGQIYRVSVKFWCTFDRSLESKRGRQKCEAFSPKERKSACATTFTWRNCMQYHSFQVIFHLLRHCSWVSGYNIPQRWTGKGSAKLWPPRSDTIRLLIQGLCKATCVQWTY